MRHCATTLGLILAAACAPAVDPGVGVPVAEQPTPDASAAAPERVAAILPESADLTSDSAADQAALQALADLEFKSLDRRAEHVRGAISPEVPASEATSTSRGGAAHAAGPTYDIDVISFAQHQRVQYYMDFFLGEARNRFRIWLGRMSRYDGMIRSALGRHGVPEDMVFLALIESGYSNTAVSRANAVGMWQFISSTGRHYGLHVDAWVDERRDPFRATEAAARHLSDLNERFDSWYLAAAAYNAGATRVSRGIRRLQNRALASADSLSDTTFFALYDRRYLRRETRDYVPKLIAAALIAKNPARYGFGDIPALEPFVFDEVTVTDATGLDVLADLADTTVLALRDLNPQFYRGVTPPDRTVVVRVPRDRGPLVARRWAELAPEERVTFIDHRIRRGETLGAIGARYGVSVSLLVAANPGIRPRQLRIGQRIVVPLSAAARRGAPAPRLSSPRPTPTHHTVRWGESLWTISQRYGVRISDLREWNSIAEEDILRVGQRLRVRRTPS